MGNNKPVAFWIPEAEQFCLPPENGKRPFAKAWRPLWEEPDFREMREMLRAMQAGELTVSRGLEILEVWWAGNWDDDMLPPVRQDLIEEDSMPVEIIDRLNHRIEELEQWRDDLIRKQNDSRRNTQLGKAIEYAAEKLPFGFQVNVEVEKDVGGIRMYDPDGDEVEVRDGDYLYETIYNAVNTAEVMAERSDRKHGQ